MPFADKNGKNRPDEGDDDAVDDEATAQESKDDVLGGVLLRRESLRFRGHHGILPEPAIARKCGWGCPRRRRKANSSLRSERLSLSERKVCRRVARDGFTRKWKRNE